MLYEFRGNSIAEAVGNAVCKERRPSQQKGDAGAQNTCRQLDRWIDQLNASSDVIENSISDIQDNIDSLLSSRRQHLEDATISALTAAAGALGSAARAARSLRHILRGGRPRLGDFLNAIPYVGGAIMTARNVLAAASDLREIRSAMQELSQVEHLLTATRGTARELQSEWDQNRCDRFYS